MVIPCPCSNFITQLVKMLASKHLRYFTFAFATLSLSSLLGLVSSLPAQPDKDTRNSEVYHYLEPIDATLTVPQIIAKYGYPVEVHEITTEDGYILQAHRIPYGKRSGPAPGKPVAWLQHGIMGDSANFIFNTEDTALAYMLANDGFDVWLGNARGNTYSRKHVSLDNTTKEFWDFSWHEMGVYDLPACFDYVLSLTGQSQLSYVGHSMGTTMFFVTMSERPEYNSKVKLMSALAPVAYLHNLKSSLGKLAKFVNQVETLLVCFGYSELQFKNTWLLEFFGAEVCRQASPHYSEICDNMLFLIAGSNSIQFNTSLIPVILGHSPAGSSAKALVHYAQCINSQRFCKFNRNYGNPDDVSVYNLSPVTVPVALYWGEDDSLADPIDVLRLAGELPNTVRNYRVNHDRYDHIDFLWAMDNARLLNNHVIELMKQY